MDKLRPFRIITAFGPWELGGQLPLWVGIFSFLSLIKVAYHAPSSGSGPFWMQKPWGWPGAPF